MLAKTGEIGAGRGPRKSHRSLTALLEPREFRRELLGKAIPAAKEAWRNVANESEPFAMLHCEKLNIEGPGHIKITNHLVNKLCGSNKTRVQIRIPHSSNKKHLSRCRTLLIATAD